LALAVGRTAFQWATDHGDLDVAADICTRAATFAFNYQEVAAKITTAAAGLGNGTFHESPLYRVPSPNGSQPRPTVQAVDREIWKKGPGDDSGPGDDAGGASSAAPTPNADAMRNAVNYLPQGGRPNIRLVRWL
jgi:hypothetical protein